MKHALFTAVTIAGLAIAAIAFSQESEPDDRDPGLTLVAPPPSQSIEDRLRGIDLKLALEQYVRIQREAQSLSFELMELTLGGAKDDNTKKEIAELEQRAVRWSAHADMMRKRIVEKYGK